jgi:hypothetical protein
MTPKNAALLAFIGTMLMTALLVWNPHQCPSGLGSHRDAVVVAHLCIRLLDRGCVLLHVPQSAVRRDFGEDGSGGVIRQEGDSEAVWLPGGVWGDSRVSEALAAFVTTPTDPSY